MKQSGNLFEDAEPPEAGERLEVLARTGYLEVERIISSAGGPSTDYEQGHDEWVVLLRGSARLTVGGEEHLLKPGDWRWLPAGVPHRVDEAAAGTVWLAMHDRSSSR